MVKINGVSFEKQYRRTTSRPIDSTDTWKSKEDAESYARNTDAEPYVPYDGQVISIEGEEDIYILVKDDTISTEDGRKHFKLHKISTEEGADDKYLSKVDPDSAKGLITFLAGIDVKIKAVIQKLVAEDATFSKEISSKDYVQNLIGWMITPDGHIDAKSLHLRDFLEVPELRYNRVSITSGEDWLAPGGGIIESVNESSQTLTLKLEPGEVANLAVDDICKGIFNNSTGFQTSYFRITQKISNSEFKYTLRSGYSYHPQKAMHFVAYGNFTNAERQKSAYSTKDYKRYLAGVNNWEITSSMVMMQLGDLSNLVISGLDLSGYSAYLRNVYMTGTIKQLSQDGTTEVLVPAFKGEWKAGKYWYYDEVTHNGSTWICIEPSTTQEPSDSSTDWLKEVSKGDPGTPGEDGRGVTSIVEQYYLSTSSSSLVGGSWSTSAPAWVNGKYIWTRSVITYTDGSSTTTDAICATGAKGETGIGVKSYREQYYLSTSYSTPAGGSWSYNVPSWTDGKFMWTRTVVTYTDNTTWTSDPVCVTGSAGPSGKGVKSFEVFYYLSTSSSSLVGGSWSTTAPKWEDGKYIWTKTKVTYTDNTTYESDPVCLTGGQGKTGLPGAMLRPRGEWKPNTEYYHNDAFIDTVIYNGNNKLCKVTHTSTSTFDSTKWDEFNEFINVATNVLLAQNATIDVLGTSGIFVGNLEKTQGWLLTEGAIRHNQTGVELTNDGRISLPETGGMIVGGKTFIEAGKIKTEFIDVDNLKVKHLDGATGTFKELQAVDSNGDIKGKISFNTSGDGENVKASLNIDFSRTWISGDLYQQGYNSADKRSWRFYTSDLWCRGEFGHSKMTTMEYYGYDTGEVYFHVYGVGNAGVRHVYPVDNGQPVDCIILSGNTNYIACVCDASPQKMIVLINNSDYTKRISLNYASQAKTEISPWSFKIFITGAMQSGVNNLFGMG